MSDRNSLVVAPNRAAGGALALPALGNLDAYISAVHRLPMLGCGLLCKRPLCRERLKARRRSRGDG